MKIKIDKGTARGTVCAPPSKSMAHRMLICAAMAEGTSVIKGISDCEDVLATLDCLRALGVSVDVDGDTARVHGRNMSEATPHAPFECRESGSTLRFLIPIALLSGKSTLFYGADGLMKRPMGVYKEICDSKGLLYVCDGNSIAVKGPLESGEYSVAGNISSQFISGLLFALSAIGEESRIRIIPPIESRSYIEMTLEALNIFGADAVWEDDTTLLIKGGRRLTAAEVSVEGDYSGAAFLDALGTLGGDVSVEGLNPQSTQGDKIYKKFYEMIRIGVPTIHIGNCPDLGPILFALAAARHGGVFTGTKRLKIKESDRAGAMAEELAKFGVSVTVSEDRVVVYPVSFHAPTKPLFGHNDHRIVMALAVLLTLTGGEIDGAEAISKSYPAFFNDISGLGIGVHKYED